MGSAPKQTSADLLGQTNVDTAKAVALFLPTDSNSTSSANLNPTNSSHGISNSSRANESTPDAPSANQDRKTSNEQSPRRNDRDRVQIKKRNVSLTMQHEAGLAWGQSNPGAAGGRFAVCAMPTDLD